MLEFPIKGHVFTAPERYAQGHRLIEAEADALNRLIASRLRDAINNGQVKTRADAQTFVLSDKALERVDAADGDVSWESLL